MSTLVEREGTDTTDFEVVLPEITLDGHIQDSTESPLVDVDGFPTPTSQQHLSAVKQKKTHIKLKLSRATTHNEETVVATCGMILARETQTKSESVSGVAVSDVSSESLNPSDLWLALLLHACGHGKLSFARYEGHCQALIELLETLTIAGPSSD